MKTLKDWFEYMEEIGYFRAFKKTSSWRIIGFIILVLIGIGLMILHFTRGAEL